MEKIGKIRSSIVAARQDIIAPIVWVGSQQINVMALMLEMLEMLEVVQELASRLPPTPTPTPTPTATPRHRRTRWKSALLVLSLNNSKTSMRTLLGRRKIS
ncbi:hypothetical protein [Serratia marcescens]|uniref:hypothetical protein n=1 Tax=Serratia marcescens TaxID=615 RepID=UPI001FB007DF|nr:hypothetical protein [Serratia marcescens]